MREEFWQYTRYQLYSTRKDLFPQEEVKKKHITQGKWPSSTCSLNILLAQHNKVFLFKFSIHFFLIENTNCEEMLVLRVPSSEAPVSSAASFSTATWINKTREDIVLELLQFHDPTASCQQISWQKDSFDKPTSDDAQKDFIPQAVEKKQLHTICESWQTVTTSEDACPKDSKEEWVAVVKRVALSSHEVVHEVVIVHQLPVRSNSYFNVLYPQYSMNVEKTYRYYLFGCDTVTLEQEERVSVEASSE